MPEGLGELYPKTRTYRERKPAIQAQTEKSLAAIRELNGKQDTEGVGVQYLFAMDRQTAQALSDAQVRGLDALFRYLVPRTLTGVALSPLHEERIKRDGTESAFKKEKQNNKQQILHDSMHLVARRALGERGKSVATIFEARSVEEQTANIETNQEELMTLLWDRGEINFLKAVLKRPDKAHNIGNYITRSVGEDFDYGAYEKEIQALQGLWETDLARYCMEAYEAYYFNCNVFANPKYRAEHADVRAYHTEHRPPEYLRVIKAIVENARKEHPNPYVLVDEALRIMEPALRGMDASEDIDAVRRRIGLGPKEEVQR